MKINSRKKKIDNLKVKFEKEKYTKKDV